MAIIIVLKVFNANTVKLRLILILKHNYITYIKINITNLKKQT